MTKKTRPPARAPGGRFAPGTAIGASTRFQPGQSGNPQGVSRLRKEFESRFYAAMTDESTMTEAMDALRSAIRAAEAWAVNLYFSKMLPPQPLDLRMEVSKRDEIDWTRISDDELEQLERIAARAAAGSSLPALREGTPSPD